jgi:hypothetical protein
MIRIEHADLPRGLTAMAIGEGRDMRIAVSRRLRPAEQRAAALAALRAARRADWRAKRPMSPLVLVPLFWGSLGLPAKRAVASVVTLAAAATVFLLIRAPELTAAQPPAPARVSGAAAVRPRSAHGRSPQAHGLRAGATARSHRASPSPTSSPSPTRGQTATPTSSPAPSSPGTGTGTGTPAPSPTAQPRPRPHPLCILGICL